MEKANTICGGTLRNLSIRTHLQYVRTKQSKYHGVEQLFGLRCIHLISNHGVGEFVATGDPLNTINDLGNQNKLLKKINDISQVNSITLSVHGTVLLP
jgi:hypothetical protein